MVEVCSASMQKSLQGLDNVTADGTQAFDDMVKIVDTLVENDLKSGFKAHVGISEHCKDHCIVYALSDPNDPAFNSECEHSHDVLCERCESLRSVLQDITQKTRVFRCH